MKNGNKGHRGAEEKNPKNFIFRSVQTKEKKEKQSLSKYGFSAI